jgi:group I intron endonuclease
MISNFDEHETNQMSGVYSIRNTKNGKIYIGQTVAFFTRWATHQYGLNKGTHHNKPLLSDWVLFGADAFEFSVVEVLDPISAVLNGQEKFWIDHYGSLDREKGYNLASIGETSALICYPCRSIKIGGYSVLERESDGYLSVTGVASLFGREISEFLSLKTTKEYIHLIDVNATDKYKGTWVHPDIFCLFAIWVDVRFRIAYNRHSVDQIFASGETVASFFGKYINESENNKNTGN